MTHVLDAGGVSALAADPRKVDAMLRRAEWPPQVSTAVLVECLTGDSRRDHATNRLLNLCQVREVDEGTARRAATLRTRSPRAGTISAVDALVVALAERFEGAVVVSSDPIDMLALVGASDHPIRVLPV